METVTVAKRVTKYFSVEPFQPVLIFFIVLMHY